MAALVAAVAAIHVKLFGAGDDSTLTTTWQAFNTSRDGANAATARSAGIWLV
jgi:hypothetical protein